MPILVLQHAATDAVSSLGRVLRDHAFALDIRRIDLAPERGGRELPPDLDGVQGLIVLGGPQNVADPLPWIDQEKALIRSAHAQQLPVIGLCLGHQLIASALGGEVAPSQTPEFGFAPVSLTPAGQTDTIFAGVPWTSTPFHAHAQEVTKLPPDATLLASSRACKVQAFRAGLRTYAFQFHFEVTRADVDAFARDPFGVELMSRLALTPDALRAQIDQHFDACAQLGHRLSTNLASFLFPSVKRLKVRG